MPPIKKLIEVSLPLDAINAESAREKSIRHGHPSTLHLWWARRPLAAARAVLWSSLVDDPSSHPELFPTEEEQNRERDRLHKLLSELVKWENSNNEELLEQARAEIRKYMGDEKLVFLDPFAGGGSIPLEAQRLGMEAHAHDLNPVAVMINKAMIEIPPKFANLPPVNPEGRRSLQGKSWSGASGLAEDVRYYGQWMKEEAFRRIGHLYPKVKLPDGSETTVIAWIWARTVKCPNPACGCEMPLASSFVLSKKKGKEAWIEPIIDEANNKISYIVKTGLGKPPSPPKTARGAKFKCLKCGADTSPDYIKAEGITGKIGAQLMAVIADGKICRIYVSPDEQQINVANVSKPENYPTGELAGDKRAIWTPLYGLDTFDKLFTPRQLTALTTFSDLVAEAQAKAELDAIAAGLPDDGIGLADGGKGAKAYGEAVGVYLAFVLDRQANYSSSLNIWADGFIAQTYGRQALPMIWDFAETNIFSKSSGCFDNMLDWVIKSMMNLPAGIIGKATQNPAQNKNGINNVIVSTDPPYYDNIGYADLSDYFYIWMRQSLKNSYPDIFKTMLVPKAEELVATPYRFGGDKEKAKKFFESGMLSVLKILNECSTDIVPITIYYAFKQSDTIQDDRGNSQIFSTGWETMLTALINANFQIVGTWPMHTERETGLKNSVNALASSIVLVCHKRPTDAPATTRRQFIAELKKSLPPAIKKMQQANIAPVDLAQAAIGPGMEIYSRYAQVLEADGSPMDVRQALQSINAELDNFFSAQEGRLDEESRFCVDLYSQYAFNDMKFGEAEVLAKAKNTSIDKLAQMGLLTAQKGIVRLLNREELPEKPVKSSYISDCLWLLTQYLVKAMASGGIAAAAKLAKEHSVEAEDARNLAYRLFAIAERKGWSREAFDYNALVTAWPEVVEATSRMKNVRMEQASLQTGKTGKTHD